MDIILTWLLCLMCVTSSMCFEIKYKLYARNEDDSSSEATHPPQIQEELLVFHLPNTLRNNKNNSDAESFYDGFNDYSKESLEDITERNDKQLPQLLHEQEKRKRICKGDDCKRKCRATVKKKCTDCEDIIVFILQAGCNGRCRKPQRKFVKPYWNFKEAFHFISECERQATDNCKSECTDPLAECEAKCKGNTINPYLPSYCVFLEFFNSLDKYNNGHRRAQPYNMDNELNGYQDIIRERAEIEEYYNPYSSSSCILLNKKRICKGDNCKKKCRETVTEKCKSLLCTENAVKNFHYGCEGRCKKPQRSFLVPHWKFDVAVDFLKHCAALTFQRSECDFLNTLISEYKESTHLANETTTPIPSIQEAKTATSTTSGEVVPATSTPTKEPASTTTSTSKESAATTSTTTTSTKETTSTTTTTTKEPPTTITKVAHIATDAPTTSTREPSTTMPEVTTTTTTTEAAATTTTTTEAPTTTTTTVEPTTTTTTTEATTTTTTTTTEATTTTTTTEPSTTTTEVTTTTTEPTTTTTEPTTTTTTAETTTTTTEATTTTTETTETTTEASEAESARLKLKKRCCRFYKGRR